MSVTRFAVKSRYDGLPQEAAQVLESGLAALPPFAGETDWQATDWLVDVAAL
jgi:hypothetical protein